MPFPQMQTLLDAAFPDGNQNYWKSTFLRAFSDDAIVVLYGRQEEVRPEELLLLEPEHQTGGLKGV